ncbi:MAG: tyrosine-type recombinase/integrase [Deltaproteobacteria bacterium]|nr:tyrosine-type recombinase/integrase [Deltaproteobacteria bacterium]
MAKVRLTDRALKALQGDGADRDLRDAAVPGLYVRVRKTGLVSFSARYYRGGARRISLGTYPEMSLAGARQLALQIRADVARGKDPGAPLAERGGEVTFRDLATEYLERHARPNKASWEEDERILKGDLLPPLGEMPAAEISRRDLIAIFDRVTDRGSPTMANRIRALLSKIYAFGISRDLVSANPAAGMPRNPEAARQTVLTDQQLTQLWVAVEAEDPSIGGCLRMLMLTLQRSQEVRLLTLDQLDDTWWNQPAGVSKNRESHRVPLEPMTMEILQAQQHLSRSRYLFPSPKDPRKPLAPKTLSHVAQRLSRELGFKWTPHDLRRTGATRLAELGVEVFVIDRLLNHRIPGVTAVYVRSQFDVQKREALRVLDHHFSSLGLQLPAMNA